MAMLMKDEFRAAVGQAFAIWPRIDLAFSLPPGGAWIRPDDTKGKHKRLGGLDRPGVDAIERELWKHALGLGHGVHWRPATDATGQTYAAYALLDDLDAQTALGILAKYRSIGIKTSVGSYQVVIATTRGMTRMEQYRVQASLVQRLLAAGHHADHGATGAGQFARMPGFPHHGHDGRTVGLLGSGDALLPLLDPDALLDDEYVAPKPAEAEGRRRASACRRPGVPARRNGGRGKAAAAGPAVAKGGSEIDWDWAWRKVRAGADPDALIEALKAAAEKRGKRGARAYAERTVAGAIERVRRRQGRKQG